MLPLMNNLVAALLFSASSFTNPTTPKALSFDASAYVTVKNEIRVAVEKSENVPVTVFLRDETGQVLYQYKLDASETKRSFKLNVDNLVDGTYELEIRSKEGSIRKQVNMKTQPVQRINRVVALD